MGTLLESKEALKARGLEVNLTQAEVDALINNRIDSLARLAFAACPPGESPTDRQIDDLLGAAGHIRINAQADLRISDLVISGSTAESPQA